VDDGDLGGIEVQLLGPVGATRDGVPVLLGGPKVRLVLAVLALSVPRVVPAERLHHLVWPDEPPASARKAVQKYVSALRRALGFAVVASESAGYRLALEADRIDALCFESELAEARTARSDGRLEDAWSSYGRALAMPASRALLGLDDVPFVADEARRLDDLWLDGREEQARVGLDLGRDGEVLGLVDALAREYPLRERLQEVLMTALYRCGRQTDALSAYQRHRRTLAEELGLVPAPALADLEARILRHDPSLAPPPDVRSGGAESTRSPTRALPRSIAVLPFADLSPQRDQGHLCDGIAEDVLSALAALDEVRVASRRSSFRYRATDIDAVTIGTALDVTAVLDGTVERLGDRLRIAVRLTDARAGSHLWSAAFDFDRREIFSIEAQIADGVVDALAQRSVPSVGVGLRRAATADVDAYDLYLRGRHLFYRGGRSPTVRACELFRAAADMAPDYALPHAGLADTSAFLLLYYDPTSERAADADEHSRRAVDLDPQLPEARSSRGFALSALGSHDDAAHEFDAALRLRADQFEALYLYGRACLASDDHRKAVALFERASRTRPDDFHVLTLLGKARRGTGDAGPARTAHRRALELVRHHVRVAPDDMRALCDGACALAELNRVDEAKRWIERAATLDDPLGYYVACAIARMGDHQSALRELARVVAAGWSHADWLRHDPDWSELRTDATFQAILDDVDHRLDTARAH
jgi:adenylate cyclase